MKSRREFLTPTRALAVLAGVTVVGFVAAVLAIEWVAGALVSLVWR